MNSTEAQAQGINLPVRSVQVCRNLYLGCHSSFPLWCFWLKLQTSISKRGYLVENIWWPHVHDKEVQLSPILWLCHLLQPPGSCCSSKHPKKSGWHDGSRCPLSGWSRRRVSSDGGFWAATRSAWARNKAIRMDRGRGERGESGQLLHKDPRALQVCVSMWNMLGWGDQVTHMQWPMWLRLALTTMQLWELLQVTYYQCDNTFDSLWAGLHVVGISTEA